MDTTSKGVTEMTQLKRLKILAVIVPLGVLIVLGASQTNIPLRNAADEEFGCAQPSKLFHFALAEVDRNRVSALMIRVFPDVGLSQMSFEPQPEEILLNKDGTLTLRYSNRALQRLNSLRVELCAATQMHEIREAYWIVREQDTPKAQLINTDQVYWEWRESGREVVPGTQRVVKEFPCTGEVLVEAYQLIGKDQPLCVKDPAALAKLQRELDELQRERTSFFGKLKALLLGEGDYEARMNAISAQMQKLYLYSPYEGTVEGVAYDELSDVVWVRLQVEEPLEIQVAP